MTAESCLGLSLMDVMGRGTVAPTTLSPYSVSLSVPESGLRTKGD